MECIEGVDNKKLDIIKTRFGSNFLYQAHLARYHFVKKFIKNKFIFDLGCGIGTGTHDLSLTAKTVIGAEIDRDRLKHAFDNFNNDNLNYLIMDGCSLGFKDNSFDVVVSLEVIEHLEDQDKLLSEVRRVLKDDGVTIISTPNKEIIKIDGTPPNPSHIKELSLKEFKKILNKYFKRIELYGQIGGKEITGLGREIHYFIRMIDLFGMRKLFSRTLKDDISIKIAKATRKKDKDAATADDFIISKNILRRARNIIAVCKK